MEGILGRQEVKKFVGTLHTNGAKKGVFIITGQFSEEAHDYVKSIASKVILIGGKALANYMIDFNLGTATIVTYEIKPICSGYFTEE